MTRIDADELERLGKDNSPVIGRAVSAWDISRLAITKNVRWDYFERCVIWGLFSFDHETVLATLDFRFCRFLDDVSFSNTEAMERVSFDHCELRSFSARETKFRKRALVSDSAVIGDTSVSDVQFAERSFFAFSTFGSHVSFTRVSFGGGASFDRSNFQGKSRPLDLELTDVRFLGEATFTYCRWDKADFENCSFAGVANFEGCGISNRLNFVNMAFEAGLNMRYARIAQVWLENVSCDGRLELDFAQFDKLMVSGDAQTVFRGRSLIRNATFGELTLSGAEFESYVSFDSTRITRLLDLDEVTFEDDVSFRDTSFPPRSDDLGSFTGVDLQDARFMKRVDLDAGSLFARVDGPLWLRREESKLTTSEDEVWRELKRAFELSGDTDSRNVAEYRIQLLEMKRRKSLTDKLTSTVSWAVWGFGLRPLRVLGWYAATVLAFAAVYWYQLQKGAARRRSFTLDVKLVTGAIAFSWWTAFKFGYGAKYAQNSLFKAVTTAESVIAKILLLLFVRALAHLSPVLNDLLGKFLPI